VPRDKGVEDSEDPSSELAPRHNRKNKEKQSQGSAGKGSGGASGGGASQLAGWSLGVTEALPGVFQYGSNFPSPSLPPPSQPASVGDAPLLLLGAAGKVITAEGSALSSETIS
jgi:hypothetical protein